MSPLLILDLPSVYYRAFYSLPSSLTDARGRPINAIKGSLAAISQLASKNQPRKIVAAVDQSWRPNWRVDLLPEYKTHRLAEDGFNEAAPEELTWQVPHLLSILNLLGITTISKKDYEADDCIATFTHFEDDSLIVTSDRDFFQLINRDRNIELHLQSDKTNPKWDHQRFTSTYGFEPHQYLDFAVLRGDPSDGLPGVAMVGEKTAARLIQQFENIEGLINNLTSKNSEALSKVEKNILASLDYIQRARQVTRLVDNLDLDITQEISNRTEALKFAIEFKVEKQINEILQIILD